MGSASWLAWGMEYLAGCARSVPPSTCMESAMHSAWCRRKLRPCAPMAPAAAMLSIVREMGAPRLPWPAATTGPPMMLARSPAACACIGDRASSAAAGAFVMPPGVAVPLKGVAPMCGAGAGGAGPLLTVPTPLPMLFHHGVVLRAGLPAT